MANIGPHGETCVHCDGKGSLLVVRHRDDRAACPLCNGTGRACPGGEVWPAAYILDGKAMQYFHTEDLIYICQTCHSVVPASEVQHG